MKQIDLKSSFTRQLLREAFSPEIHNLFGLVVGFIATGTLFYTNVEHWRAFDALYFSVMTLTTVGTGSQVPVTDAGKLFTMIFIFGGLGIVFTFLTALAREQAKEPFFFRLLNRSNKKDQS